MGMAEEASAYAGFCASSLKTSVEGLEDLYLTLANLLVISIEALCLIFDVEIPAELEHWNTRVGELHGAAPSE